MDNLQITNIPDEKGHRIEYIRVVSNQRNKARTIPLNPKASSAIRDYLSDRRGSAVGNLFLNRMGEGLGDRGVEKVIGKYL